MSGLSFHRGPLPGEPADARFVEVDGVRVRFTDTDEPSTTRRDISSVCAVKPTVVLVHGFASALEVWNPVAPALARTHRVISLDLKGFGWTERPAGDYSPEAQAALVLRLLDLRGVRRAAIVAHSWGSSVALAAALEAPDRVTRLALYSAWVYEDQLPPFFHLVRTDGVGEALFGMFYRQRTDERIALAFFEPGKYVTRGLVAEIDAALARPGTIAAALAAVRAQRYADIESRYRAVRAPTLLLWGREDAVTRLRFGERLRRDLPNARLITYARCGHFPMIEAASASTRHLAQFLATQRGDDDDEENEP